MYKRFVNIDKVAIGMIIIGILGGTPSVKGNVHKERIIVDTDMGPDYDDVGAIAVLHHLADEGKADILATVSSNKMEKTVQLLHVLNRYYGRPDLPIGVVKGEALSSDAWHKGEKWTEELLKRYPTDHTIASATEDAVSIYRKVLASQEDQSVVIVTIGFLTNLKNLMLSPADSISPLSGIDLIKKKVKRVVSMAGRFPQGREYNIYAEAKSAKYVFDHWPTEIIFSGVEIGRYIRTGDRLITAEIPANPIKDAYAISIPQDLLEFDNSRYEMGGRASYDQTAILVAICGVQDYFDEERGRIMVSEDGSNRWIADQQGPHIRLLHKYPFSYIADIIEEMMICAPKLNDVN